MSNHAASLMLKIFVLYVHQEYTSYEIAKKLNMSRPHVTEMLQEIAAQSPQLAEMIAERKQKNYESAGKRRHRDIGGDYVN